MNEFLKASSAGWQGEKEEHFGSAVVSECSLGLCGPDSDYQRLQEKRVSSLFRQAHTLLVQRGKQSKTPC